MLNFLGGGAFNVVFDDGEYIYAVGRDPVKAALAKCDDDLLPDIRHLGKLPCGLEVYRMPFYSPLHYKHELYDAIRELSRKISESKPKEGATPEEYEEARKDVLDCLGNEDVSRAVGKVLDHLKGYDKVIVDVVLVNVAQDEDGNLILLDPLAVLDEEAFLGNNRRFIRDQLGDFLEGRKAAREAYMVVKGDSSLYVTMKRIKKNGTPEHGLNVLLSLSCAVGDVQRSKVDKDHFRELVDSD